MENWIKNALSKSSPETQEMGKALFESGKLRNVREEDGFLVANYDYELSQNGRSLEEEVYIAVDHGLPNLQKMRCECTESANGMCPHEVALLYYVDKHGLPWEKKEIKPMPTQMTDDVSLDVLPNEELNKLLEGSIKKIPVDELRKLYYDYARTLPKLREEIILKYPDESSKLRLIVIRKAIETAIRHLEDSYPNYNRINGYLQDTYRYYYNQYNYEKQLKEYKQDIDESERSLFKSLDDLAKLSSDESDSWDCYLTAYEAAQGLNRLFEQNGTEELRRKLREVLDKIMENVYFSFPADSDLRARMIATLSKQYEEAEGTDFFLSTVLDNFLRKILSNEEYYRRKLEELDETIILNKRSSIFDAYEVARRLEYMDKLNYPEDEIVAFQNKYLDLIPVNYFIFNKAMERGDLKAAESALRFIMDTSASAEERRLANEALIEIYETKGQSEKAADMIIDYISDFKQKDGYYLRKLKELLSEDQWKHLFKTQFADFTVEGMTQGEFYRQEGMWEELLDYVLKDKSLRRLDHYEDLLKRLYPKELAKFIIREVDQDLVSANNRVKYASAINKLKRLEAYPNGHRLAQEAADRLRDKYFNKSAFKDELRKAGY